MSKHMQYSITTTPITPTLTKLEYFAALVMAQKSVYREPEEAARNAIEYAQALVAELAKAEGGSHE